MRTQYYTAASLDGFIADPDHTLAWLLQFTETAGYDAFYADVGALVMGATTYTWVLDHLTTPDGAPAWPYTRPTWVMTHRVLPIPPGADVRFAQGDVQPVHAALTDAAQGRNVWIVGGGDLAGQFYDAGLLDDLIVTVAPVTLGTGTPLLPRAITAPPLRLVSALPYGDTFVQLHYAVPPP